MGLAGQRVWDNVTATKIYFNTTGSQTLRIQSREDGLSIDQIILSPNSSHVPDCVAGSAEERHQDLPGGARCCIAPDTVRRCCRGPRVTG